MEAAGARTAVVGVAAEDGARENLHTFRFRCDVRAFGCLMSEVEHVGSGWCMFLVGVYVLRNTLATKRTLEPRYYERNSIRARSAPRPGAVLYAERNRTP